MVETPLEIASEPPPPDLSKTLLLYSTISAVAAATMAGDQDIFSLVENCEGCCCEPLWFAVLEPFMTVSHIRDLLAGILLQLVLNFCISDLWLFFASGDFISNEIQLRISLPPFPTLSLSRNGQNVFRWYQYFPCAYSDGGATWTLRTGLVEGPLLESKGIRSILQKRPETLIKIKLVAKNSERISKNANYRRSAASKFKNFLSCAGTKITF